MEKRNARHSVFVVMPTYGHNLLLILLLVRLWLFDVLAAAVLYFLWFGCAVRAVLLLTWLLILVAMHVCSIEGNETKQL